MHKVKIVLLSLSVFGLFSLNACLDDDDDGSCIEQLGPITSETRQVNDFSGISLSGIGNIFLTQGPTQSLRIETHQRVLDLLETNVVNNTLFINLEGCIRADIDQLDIFITIPDINVLSINGVGNIEGQNDFDLDELTINLTGVGDISISGTTTILNITSSGVGNIRAFDLVADTCDVLISGVGEIEVTVNNELDVVITGAGNLHYKGTPSLTVDISGSGQVIDAN